MQHSQVGGTSNEPTNHILHCTHTLHCGITATNIYVVHNAQRTHQGDNDKDLYIDKHARI